jgi:hypothetical protein
VPDFALGLDGGVYLAVVAGAEHVARHALVAHPDADDAQVTTEARRVARDAAQRLLFSQQVVAKQVEQALVLKQGQPVHLHFPVTLEQLGPRLHILGHEVTQVFGVHFEQLLIFIDAARNEGERLRPSGGQLASKQVWGLRLVVNMPAFGITACCS